MFIAYKKSDKVSCRFMVIELGFEPRTHSLEGCCSIQLSYPTDLIMAIPFGIATAKVVTLF